ncbi:MAG: ABC transporter permease [Acidobacteria bacterium]|nr:ABC transporter permease [Acidobacteriota bacterium]MBI3421802.1 ABC transporter permease [Acidobacteriota bacterium]
MKIPLSYNIRNLIARRTTTLMTALGIALTVAVLLSISAMVEGLRSSLEATGHPLHLLVTRKGANAELNSNVTQEQFQTIKVKPGIARTPEGEPMASLELVTVILLESPENPAGINISLRGLTPVGFAMRDYVRIAEGRMFQPGRREVVVGKGLAKRYPKARLGGKLEFGRGAWEVVGVMDGGRSAANSEVFCDLAQLASDQNRETALSSVLIRATDAVAMQALMNDLKEDRRLNADAVTEKAYYQEQMASAAPIRFLGMFVAIIMAIGSSFAAMNTMYAAVARRAPEIGTLRVLGFSKLGILTSFLIEALLLSLLGGVIGCLLVLPLNDFTTGIGSFITFSEFTFNFRITPAIMLMGIAFAVVMGIIGGLFPAGAAARKEILAALKQS